LQNNIKVLVIVPAFNEAENIAKLIGDIKKYDYRYEVSILVVNDYSTDSTSTICNDLGVSTINLPCNLGIGGAVQTGYKFAKKYNYNIAIQVDGDGQHNPEYIEKLIEPLLFENADMVIGSRFIENIGFQSSKLRRLGIQYLKNLINAITNLKVTDPTSGFRACNKKVIDIFADNYPKDYPEPESIMLINRKGLKVSEIPVIMNERKGGVSSINLTRSVYYMVKVSLAILFDKIRKETL